MQREDEQRQRYEQLAAQLGISEPYSDAMRAINNNGETQNDVYMLGQNEERGSTLTLPRYEPTVYPPSYESLFPPPVYGSWDNEPQNGTLNTSYSSASSQDNGQNRRTLQRWRDIVRNTMKKVMRNPFRGRG